MLEIKNVCISIDDRYLVENLSLILNKGDKLAIIGEEGNGKSTLLRAILGICEYAKVTGTINRKENRIGFLEQIINRNQTVHEFLFSSENDYYEKIGSFYSYLEEFQLSDTILKQEINTLSGGEKVKIGLLKLLLNDYDILCLDEPTNDLDIQTLVYLEQFMKSTDKPIIYVSHDEVLLANTANMILHLEQRKKKKECCHTVMRIDYDTYVNMRLRKIEKQEQVSKSERREHHKKEEKLNRVMQKVEHRQNIISRSSPHEAKMLKRKMHSLKSQERKLNNEVITEMPDVEEHIHFFFEEVKIPKTKIILKLTIPELKIKDRILSSDIKLDIIGPEHICIYGKNGTGKTTLIKKIYEDLKNRKDIILGYMPQNYEDILSEYETVLDFLAPTKSKESITKARLYLGNMKFIKEEMTGDIKSLSGGTKAKLFLIKLVLEKCNVLLLDEPTRNVSPLSNPVIRDVLKEYTGTIISISHDRKYIEEVAEHLYLFTSEGLKKER